MAATMGMNLLYRFTKFTRNIESGESVTLPSHVLSEHYKAQIFVKFDRMCTS